MYVDVEFCRESRGRYRIGPRQFHRSHGDAVFTTTFGRSEPTDTPGGVFHIVEIQTITGGTGRFAGRPRELYGGPFNRPEHGPHVRFLPPDHDFPRCGSLRTPSACAGTPPVLDGLRARIFCWHRSLRRRETWIDSSKVLIPPPPLGGADQAGGSRARTANAVSAAIVVANP